ncbi:Bud site selection protein bud4 [Ceratobasidium sp. 423]|nr:Bud site selection protein bud4 [Ceratobasidium sp. 423]
MLITIDHADREREMTGRERIKAREEMILQKRRKLRGRPSRPAFDLEEKLLLDVPVDSEELALEESFNMQLGNIYSGEVDNGKAWRTLCRPVDMNEYAKVIQEIRVQPGSTNAHGKVFVKVRRLQKLCIPIPNSLRPSLALSTTGNSNPNSERGKLAFSLPIKIRKDSHIVN